MPAATVVPVVACVCDRDVPVGAQAVVSGNIAKMSCLTVEAEANAESRRDSKFKAFLRVPTSFTMHADMFAPKRYLVAPNTEVRPSAPGHLLPKKCFLRSDVNCGDVTGATPNVESAERTYCGPNSKQMLAFLVSRQSREYKHSKLFTGRYPTRLPQSKQMQKLDCFRITIV